MWAQGAWKQSSWKANSWRGMFAAAKEKLLVVFNMPSRYLKFPKF